MTPAFSSASGCRSRSDVLSIGGQTRGATFLSNCREHCAQQIALCDAPKNLVACKVARCVRAFRIRVMFQCFFRVI